MLGELRVLFVQYGEVACVHKVYEPLHITHHDQLLEPVASPHVVLKRFRLIHLFLRLHVPHSKNQITSTGHEPPAVRGNRDSPQLTIIVPGEDQTALVLTVEEHLPHLTALRGQEKDFVALAHRN